MGSPLGILRPAPTCECLGPGAPRPVLGRSCPLGCGRVQVLGIPRSMALLGVLGSLHPHPVAPTANTFCLIALGGPVLCSTCQQQLRINSGLLSRVPGTGGRVAGQEGTVQPRILGRGSCDPRYPICQLSQVLWDPGLHVTGGEGLRALLRDPHEGTASPWLGSSSRARDTPPALPPPQGLPTCTPCHHCVRPTRVPEGSQLLLPALWVAPGSESRSAVAGQGSSGRPRAC